MKPTASRVLSLLCSALVAIPLLAAGPPAAAQDDASTLRLGGPFGEGMVLQAGKPVRVWGVDAPGTRVSVTLAGAEADATADGDGAWSVELPAMQEEGPHEMSVSGSTEVTLGDVLVGEVWYCSGQSNMAWRLKQAQPGPAVMNAPADGKLRYLRMPNRSTDEPQPSFEASWESSSPETRPEVSAVAYFFAAKLREELDRPVGLVIGAWGGSKIEAWLPEASFEASPFADSLREMRANNLERYEAAMQKYRDGGKKGKAPPAGGAGPQHEPTALYNGMTHAVEPLSIAGVLWYQGESNSWQPDVYVDLFDRLVASYREGFRDPELPVNFVQLPNFETKSSWSTFRQAQRASAEADPLVGMAVTIDVGDPKDIHPRNKQPVGERLARLALVNTYGRDDVVAGSPRPTSVRFDPEDPKRVLVTFDRVGSGLMAKPGGQPIAGVNLVDTRTKTFGNAEVEIVSADTIALTSDDVPAPNQVRHANINNPPVHLFSGEDLPVEPFVVAIDGTPQVEQEVDESAASGAGGSGGGSAGGGIAVDGDRLRFPGFSDNTGSPLQRKATAAFTGGGMTLEVATESGNFTVTKTGTGMESDGEEQARGNPKFQLNDNEPFTLTFDAAGTLDAVVLGHFPGSSKLTFTNGDEAVTVENFVGGDFTEGVESEVGLAFEGGDVIEVTSDSDRTAKNTRLTFRLADLVVTPAAGAPAEPE